MKRKRTAHQRSGGEKMKYAISQPVTNITLYIIHLSSELSLFPREILHSLQLIL